MRLQLVLAVVLATALTIPAAAEGCIPTTTDAEVDTGETPEGRFYVDIHWCHMCTYGFVLWVYEESNGIDGLQRGDEMRDDTCGGQIVRDTIVF